MPFAIHGEGSGSECSQPGEYLQRRRPQARRSLHQRQADEFSPRAAVFEAEAQPLCRALSEFYLVTRYPGFDLEDPDWPTLRTQCSDVTELLERIRTRLAPIIPQEKSRG